MQHKRIVFVFFFAFVLFGLSGCSQGSPARSTLSQVEIETFSAQTVTAVQRQTQSAPVISTPTPQVSITETPTVSPTVSSPPTNTRKAVPNPENCNRTGVIDVTIPDEWMTTQEDHFIKTWRFTNFGTCTWNTKYSLVFESGDRMDAPDSVPLSADPIPPGGSVDVSVNLLSPAKNGTFQGYFKLRADDGTLFGIIWVKIKVVTALPTAP